MKKKGLAQEDLKIIACVSMLLDHIGAALVPGDGLRIVGRLAFPIYCFLLSEGIHYTKNPKQYGLRLLAGAVFAEIPFDLLLFGSLTWKHASVMVTLLLGFGYAMACKQAKRVQGKLLLLLPFLAAAHVLGCDYGMAGVGMIAMFLLTRDLPRRRIIQTLGLAALCDMMNSYPVSLGMLEVPIELFAVLAMIPIACYDGRKRTHSVAAQWGFYLFYPVHLLVLLLIRWMMA